MKITEIVVTSGRTFNHPHESYSNLRPSVTLKATLDEGDDAAAAVKELQARAESLVEDHKQNLLKSIEELAEMERREREMASLESLIRTSQGKLDSLRKNQLELPEPTWEEIEKLRPKGGETQ